jgi:hypothetical protein
MQQTPTYLQLVQVPNAGLYVPRGHWVPAGAGVVLPDEHVNPASQGPLQLADVRPDTSPKRPAGHSWHALAPSPLHWPAGQGLLQVGLMAPADTPTYPALQLVHDVAPAALHLPAGQASAPGVGDPAPCLQE